MISFCRFLPRPLAPSHQRRPKTHRPVASIFLGGAIVAAAFFLWLHGQPQRIMVQPSERMIDLTLAQGETLHAALIRLGLDPGTALDIGRALRPLVDPRRIPVGQNLRLFFDLRENRLIGLEYPLEHEVLRLRLGSHGWLVERREASL